ncbi:glycosyltransferase [Ensifer sp. IC4062]|nr:glycosyltransferase [Ensifer sp. IC4062]
MKIVLAIKYVNNRMGGAERVVCTLANGLAQHGHEVIISNYEGRGRPNFDLDDRVRLLNGKDFRGHQTKHGRLNRALPDSLRKIPSVAWWKDNGDIIDRWSSSILSHTPDVVVGFLPHTFTPLSVGLTGRVPLVVSLQNSPQRDLFDPTQHNPSAYDRWKRQRAAKLAQSVVVLRPEYISALPHAIARKATSIGNSFKPFRGRRDDTQTYRQIIAAGRFTAVKRFDTLIEAMDIVRRSHPDWRLVIYGDGPERDRLLSLRRELWLQRNVILPGTTSRLQHHMKQSDVFVIPSIYEGFPLVLGEAFSVALPAVGFFDCTGVNTMIPESKGGILAQERTPEALADAIVKLIDDDEMRRRFGRRAQDYIRGFSEEKFISSWEKVLHDAVRS